jgi:hypothetical protein
MKGRLKSESDNEIIGTKLLSPESDPIVLNFKHKAA